jgi:hypothetical protein
VGAPPNFPWRLAASSCTRGGHDKGFLAAGVALLLPCFTL